MPEGFRDHYDAHVNEVQGRWEAALDAEHFAAVLVHSGAQRFSFLDDYEYAFRPNPHFLAWVPLTHHHDSALLVVPGHKPRLFYYQPVDYWYLPPADPESWWAEHFDIEVMRDPSGWEEAFRSGLDDLGLDADTVAAVGDAPALDGLFASDHLNPDGLLNRLHLARTRKTRYEIACIETASLLAAQAHREAETAFREGRSEYEIHLRYLGACRHTDYELPYNNIVALNHHGSVLHYQGRDRESPERSRSFLIDAGSAVNAYASDITRTHAAEAGEFAELIEAMDRMQRGLVDRIRAGVDYRALHLHAHREVAGVLKSFGIVGTSADEAVESGLSSVFFPHGLGHYIGLQTHDVAGLIDNEGRSLPRPEGHPFLRLTRELEADNVLTIEPGLYFIEPLLRRWREERGGAGIHWDTVERLAPYGGIRVEDNVVVTETGCRNLTREAFAALE